MAIESNKNDQVIEETKIVESPKPVQDTTSSTPVVVAKKKISFREKHKQGYDKDSLRPLFIPVK